MNLHKQAGLTPRGPAFLVQRRLDGRLGWWAAMFSKAYAGRLDVPLFVMSLALGGFALGSRSLQRATPYRRSTAVQRPAGAGASGCMLGHSDPEAVANSPTRTWMLVCSCAADGQWSASISGWELLAERDENAWPASAAPFRAAAISARLRLVRLRAAGPLTVACSTYPSGPIAASSADPPRRRERACSFVAGSIR